MQPVLSDDGDPHVIVVGESAVERALTRALRRIDVDARRAGGTLEAVESMSPWTRAVVLAPPLPRLRPETAVPVLERLAHEASADLILVAPEDDAELTERVRAITDERDAEAYAWPRDALRLTTRLRATGGL